MDHLQPASPERAARALADTVARAHAGAHGLQSSFSIQPENNGSDQDAGEEGAGTQDKFAHTRGKRKRTSREDFAVLEGEYQRNSRPDKTTRGSIVARVSMTEKEVQIWFQNRRQMTRRKCRTWQPNEITSIIRSSQEQNVAVGSDQQDLSSEGIGAPKDEEAGASSQPVEDLATESSLTEPSQVVFSCASSQAPVTEASSEANNVRSDSQISSGVTRLQEVDIVTEVRTNDMVDASLTTESEAKKTERRRELKRKSSAVRLSLSFDGKAEVVLGSESPSPPKKPALGEGRSGRLGPLQRSQSAIDPANQVNQPLGTDIPEWRPSRALGRSRDARTWEFYCDSDARNVLTKSAEHDQKGSAQAVLGLIRSGSNTRKPLTPVKRENVSLQRADSGAKKTPASRAASRGKLARAMSSVARLQTTKQEEEYTTKPAKSKLGGKIEIWEDNFGDSDKENQDPDEDTCRRSSSQGASMLSDPLPSTEDKENENSKQPLLASEPARADDELDAVQNLLRLSQGAWC